MHPLKTAGTAEVELPGAFLIRMRPGQTFDFGKRSGAVASVLGP